MYMRACVCTFVCAFVSSKYNQNISNTASEATKEPENETVPEKKTETNKPKHPATGVYICTYTEIFSSIQSQQKQKMKHSHTTRPNGLHILLIHG